MVGRRRQHGSARAYTLVEVLVVVTVLGIAGALVVPSFSQTGVLRVQAAVRTIVSDLTVAQSDAVAFQRGMGVIFYPGESVPRYVVAEVNGTTLDPDLDRVLERRIVGAESGNAVLESVNLNNNTVIFDGLGGPVASPGSATPANTGWIDLAGSGQRFRISIEAFTGRVTVADLGEGG